MQSILRKRNASGVVIGSAEKQAEPKADLHIRLIIRDPPKKVNDPGAPPSFVKRRPPPPPLSRYRKKKPHHRFPTSAHILDSDLKKLQHSDFGVGGARKGAFKGSPLLLSAGAVSPTPSSSHGSVEWLTASKLVVQPDAADFGKLDPYKRYPDQNVKPVVEHIEGDIQYDFRTKTHTIE